MEKNGQERQADRQDRQLGKRNLAFSCIAVWRLGANLLNLRWRRRRRGAQKKKNIKRGKRNEVGQGEKGKKKKRRIIGTCRPIPTDSLCFSMWRCQNVLMDGDGKKTGIQRRERERPSSSQRPWSFPQAPSLVLCVIGRLGRRQKKKKKKKTHITSPSEADARGIIDIKTSEPLITFIKHGRVHPDL